MKPRVAMTLAELVAEYGPHGTVTTELVEWALAQYPRVRTASPLKYMQIRHEVSQEGERLFHECNWVWMAVDDPMLFAEKLGLKDPMNSEFSTHHIEMAPRVNNDSN